MQGDLVKMKEESLISFLVYACLISQIFTFWSFTAPLVLIYTTVFALIEANFADKFDRIEMMLRLTRNIFMGVTTSIGVQYMIRQAYLEMSPLFEDQSSGLIVLSKHRVEYKSSNCLTSLPESLTKSEFLNNTSYDNKSIGQIINSLKEGEEKIIDSLTFKKKLHNICNE